MPVKGVKLGRYAKNANVVCSWCGRLKKMTRFNATTCSDKCRLRMFRFRQMTGFDPEHPAGDVTAKAAFDVLVGFLLLREKRRLLAGANGYPNQRRANHE